jgi:hypothetical protein
LSERTATIDEQGVRQPIGVFGVQRVLLLQLSLHGSPECNANVDRALVVEHFDRYPISLNLYLSS